MKKYFPLYLTIFLFIRCSTIPQNVRVSLEKAGTNKQELIEVINHYKKEGNKEKLWSAYFLISNMEGKKSSNYPDLLQVYSIVADSIHAQQNCHLPYKILNEKVKIWLDSLQLIYGDYQRNITTKEDLQNITSDYLIENIDLAYDAWKNNPWAKNLDFKKFCEYILPYRILDEPLQNWRKAYLEKYKMYADSLKDPSDPLELCKLINNRVAREYQFFSNLALHYVGMNDMQKLQAGLCEHRYLLLISALRSMGVPARLDYCPQWARWAGNHHWVVILTKSGEIVAFNGGEPFEKSNAGNKMPVGGGKASKIYHITYANYKNSRPTINDDFFNLSNFVDVTEEYDNPGKNVKILLNDFKLIKGRYVYLYTFGKGLDVVPVAYAKAKRNPVLFKNIGRDGIYFAADADLQGYKPLSQAFEIHKEIDTPIFYNPYTNKKINARFYSKYPVADSMVNFAQAMAGAKFQGSHTRDFKNPVDLDTIITSPDAYKEGYIELSEKFRFVRYLPPDSNYMNIAELSFYTLGMDSTYKKLHGKIIGYTPDKSIFPDFKNAFDNDIRSNLNCPPHSWIGLDFGKEYRIAMVKYLPRNTLNVIEPGNQYELYYFDYGWKFIEQKKASDFYIEFNVPERNTVFLLKNLTQGHEERIFILDHWKNYMQVYY